MRLYKIEELYICTNLFLYKIVINAKYWFADIGWLIIMLVIEFIMLSFAIWFGFIAEQEKNPDLSNTKISKIEWSRYIPLNVIDSVPNTSTDWMFIQFK